MFSLPLFAFENAASILSDNINVGTLITELVICVLLIALFFIFRQRLMKILCACGAEFCLWLACKMAFGDDFILTHIMTWVTAAAVICLMIAIVNRINWGRFRDKQH